MGQLGYDPLVAIAAMVPFESFRPKLKAALIKGELRRSGAERKNSAGRLSPFAVISMSIIGDPAVPLCAHNVRQNGLWAGTMWRERR